MAAGMKQARPCLACCRRRHQWAAALLLGLLLPAPPAIPGRGLPPDEITVAVPKNSPPLLFNDENGQLQGLRVDMWSLWEASTGIRVHLRPVDWSTAKALVLSGEADAVDIVSSAEEEGDRLLLSLPYMPSDLTLYFHQSISGIVDANSARGFLIGVRDGGACIPELTAGGSQNLVTFPSFEALVAAALDGGIRVFCLPDQQASYLLNRSGRADEFRRSPPLRSISLHWAVRQRDDDTRRLIATGFAKIPLAERKATTERWLGSALQQTSPYLRHLSKVLIAALLALAVLLVWLWTLRRAVKHRTTDLLAARSALAERVRQQTCLNAVFKASEDLDAPVPSMLADVAGAVRAGAARPQTTGVEIEWDGQHYLSSKLDDADVRLSAPLRLDGQVRGKLTVGHRSTRQDGGGRALDDLQALVDVVAQRLATVFERRALQDERREFDRQMFQMEKLSTMGELTMGLAHEIGNPLGGMKAVVQSLQFEAAISDDMRGDLVRLESEIDRLSAFLRGFHGYAAEQAPAPEACMLRQILDDVVLWTRRDASSRKVRIELGDLDALPPLWADRHQLKQVLLNLVLNAIQVQPDGGMVTIEATCSGRQLTLTMTDSGPGIPQDVLARIFEPFFTTRPGGSGLGLPIVRKIVQDHGGRIAVASAQGGGTRVTLSWPIATRDHDPDDPAR